jgi:hypothetical protein
VKESEKEIMNGEKKEGRIDCEKKERKKERKNKCRII